MVWRLEDEGNHSVEVPDGEIIGPFKAFPISPTLGGFEFTAILRIKDEHGPEATHVFPIL
jgi:hypothetical protein